ncbi:curculin (mannose-binding) lectin protein, partial [Candidatus Woesearchaeota archaeon]
VTLDDVSSMVAPLNIVDRIEDMALVDDLQINGTLGITKALSHDYPLGTYVSSALITQDLFARVTNVFAQVAWTSVWSDDVIGDVPLAVFNDTAHPIAINNAGGTQERWMVKFKTSTSFDVFGEFSGLVGSGTIDVEFYAENPASTSEPKARYFTIPYNGWGTGWSTGNVVRFNTIAANKPVWVARTVLQSEAYSGTDQFCIEIRGDIDTP